MTILYILKDFPKMSSETFILNEITLLINKGHDIWVLADKTSANKTISHNKFLEYNLDKKIIIAPKYWRGTFKILDFILKIIPSLINDYKSTAKLLNIIFNKKEKLVHENFWDKLDIYLTINKLLKTNCQPNLIYCPFAHYQKVNLGLNISKVLNIPFACAFRALELYSQDNIENIKLNYNNFLKADAFVTISLQNKIILKNIFFQKVPIYVIHSIINTELFNDNFKYSFDKELNILTIARFVEKKGIKYLLKTLKMLKDNNIRFNYTLIGDGPLKNSYIKLITELNLEKEVKIIKPLKQEKIKEEMSKCNLFILPCVIAENGDRDILANVLKEAMAMKKIVLSSNISSINELIEDGKNGFLFKEKDSQAIYKTILKVINLDKNKITNIQKKAREKIVKEFSPESESQKLENLFLSLIKKN